MNKMIVANLAYRPLRSLISIVAVAVEVTLILLIVGLATGMLNDSRKRQEGTGADIIVRPPGSSNLIGLSGAPVSEKVADILRKQSHVVAVSPVVAQLTSGGNIEVIYGIDLASFEGVGGPFHYLEGGPFQGPDDMLVDDYFASANKVRVGNTVEVLNHKFRVAGVVEHGRGGRRFIPIRTMQDLIGAVGKATMFYVKLDDPSRTEEAIATLRTKLKNYQIYSMEEYTSLFSIANVPMLKQFIWVVIGLGVLVGFLVVFLSMYTAVLERTREIGVLKALGASPGYVLNILLRETTLLAAAGSVLGILLSYVTRFTISSLVPGTLIQAIVPNWWPITAGIALVGALLGAIYPGLKAARQDAVEALAYE